MHRPEPSLALSAGFRWTKPAIVLGFVAHLSACAADRNFDQGKESSTTSPTQEDEVGTASEPKLGSGAQGTTDASQGDLSTQDQATPPSGPDPKKLLQEHLASYCDSGSVSCFMMDELDNQLLVDQGQAKLPINPHDSKLVVPNLDSYLFDSALQVVLGERPESIKTFKLPENGIIGFDVWLKPNRTSSTTRWNAVAMDGFLSIQTVAPNTLACKYNVGLSNSFPLIPKPELIKASVEFPENDFVHVGCAWDGSNVSLWLDGVEFKGPKHDRVILPTSSRYLLNWKSAFQTPFDGLLGPLRVWHDIPTMRSQLRSLHHLLAITK